MSNHARFWRSCVGSLFLTCGLMLAGCGGSSQATVSGKASYKGQPLKGGTVSVIPRAGGVVSAAIQEDGSYTISKVPIGPATVTVETMSLRPTARAAMPGPYANAPKDVMPGARSQGDEKRYVPIPEQYSDPESSGLTLDVKKGTQQHDIDLK